MDIEIVERGAFGSALVRLAPGERFTSESGAMFRASGNVDIDVTTRARGRGGVFAGVKRMLAAESFFFSTYTTNDGRPGEVGLAPTLEGEVRRLELDGGRAWVCAGGSYLGSGPEIDIDTQFQGLRGLLSGESMSFLRCSGEGPLLVNAFGGIREVAVDGALIVDTGHLVAFEAGLDYSVTKAGRSWLSSVLGGEGLVLRFRGEGRILTQSHDPRHFGRMIGRRLPPRS